MYVLPHSASYRTAAYASEVPAKPCLARPLRVFANSSSTADHRPGFVCCCPVRLGSHLLCSPSPTDLIIEVTRRSGRFPLRGWQSTVLLEPRISSGSPLKGLGHRPCPHLPQWSSSLDFHVQRCELHSTPQNAPLQRVQHVVKPILLGDAI